MDYRALVASSLVSIGVDADRVREIQAGAPLYGESGLLDSVHLVGLIATLGERLDDISGTTMAVFQEPNWTLIDEFKDIETLVAFLERNCGSLT